MSLAIPNRAIFALDPGGHTGVARVIVDIKAPLAEMFHKSPFVFSDTIVGNEYEQIRDIANMWVEFYRDCVLNKQMPPETVEFVSEDFIQRPGGSGGKEGNSPVRILWGVEGYRMGRAAEFKGRQKSRYKIHAPPAILQHPSLAAQITSAQLKEYGLWVVGKDHERSAFKHVVTRIKKIKQSIS